jgi:hypothetical protein
MTPEFSGDKSRLRFEPLDEWFFPAPVYVDGFVCPAPSEAVAKYSEMRDVWLKNQPKTTTEIPEVRIQPVLEEERAGYIVQIGVVYPPIPKG